MRQTEARISFSPGNGFPKGVFMKRLYLKDGRLADLFALIQVLALDEHAYRSEEGLFAELQGVPRSHSSWTEVAMEHPEFFRVNPTSDHGLSLVARHVSQRTATNGRPVLSAEHVQALLNLILEIHDREAAQASSWRSWLPFWGALVGSLLSLLGTYATYRYWKHESAASPTVVECHGTVDRK